MMKVNYHMRINYSIIVLTLKSREKKDIYVHILVYTCISIQAMTLGKKAYWGKMQETIHKSNKKILF